MSEKRRDHRGRILHNGEIQLSDGRYRFKYVDEMGKERCVYSWRLDPVSYTHLDVYKRQYSNNLLKRLVKTSKLYFYDTGLVCYLTKWSSAETLESGAMNGAILENYVVDVYKRQILKQAKKSYENIFSSNISTGILSGNHKDMNADYIFSTVQTLSRDVYKRQENMYDTLFCASEVPPIRLLLSVNFGLFQALDARADLSLGLTGFGVKISDLKVSNTNIVLMDYANIQVDWIPYYKMLRCV